MTSVSIFVEERYLFKISNISTILKVFLWVRETSRFCQDCFDKLFLPEIETIWEGQRMINIEETNQKTIHRPNTE